MIDTDCWVKRRITVVEKVDVVSNAGDYIGRFVYSHNNGKTYDDKTKKYMGSQFSKLLRYLIDAGVKK